MKKPKKTKEVAPPKHSSQNKSIDIPEPLKRDSVDTGYSDPPFGFTITEQGIFYDGGEEVKNIYPYPLWVSSVNCDYLGESVTIRHRLPHDGWKDVTFPSNKICDQRSFFSTMFDSHIGVTGKDNRGLFMVYMETFMSQVRAQTRLSQLSGQMGWRDDLDGLAFVHGGEIYMKDGSSHRVGYSATAPEFIRGMKPVGNATQWIENTKILNRKGLEGLAFEFLCGAFGAPLVRFTGFEGAMLAVVGDSGLGKTVVGR